MSKQRQFTVTGLHAAYGTQPGDTVTLDPDDDGVQANVAAGVIVLTSETTDKKE